MKRISLETLIHSRQNLSYQEQYEYVCKLLQEEKIKPVKASRTNGKKPALYREYWILEEQKGLQCLYRRTEIYSFNKDISRLLPGTSGYL